MSSEEAKAFFNKLRLSIHATLYVLNQLDISKADFGPEIVPILRDADRELKEMEKEL